MRYSTMLLGALMATACAQGALACGYHLGLANATFETVHPKSLGVAVALRRATDRGLINARPKTASLSLFGGEYRRAVQDLLALEERLAGAAPDFENDKGLRFAFVFVQTRLWTRYIITSGKAGAIVHALPADDGETVVLSDESVLNAILNGRLAFDAAIGQGLVQIVNDRNGVAFHILRAALGGDSPRPVKMIHADNRE